MPEFFDWWDQEYQTAPVPRRFNKHLARPRSPQYASKHSRERPTAPETSLLVHAKRYLEDPSDLFKRLPLQPELKILRHLEWCCRERTDLLSSRWRSRYSDALIALSAHWRDWVRPLDHWEPTESNPEDQFASLVRHLLVLYEVPHFMDAAWQVGLTATGIRQQGWFKHIGQGENIRTAEGLPVPMTKRMTHFFVQGSSDLPILGAFRYAQVLGLGGQESLARSLLGTRLGTDFDNHDFWVTVIRWLIDHPKVEAVHHGPIIDFLHDRKYVPSVINPRIHLPGQPELIPARPNLSIKRRSPASLLRAVEIWHREMYSRRKPILGDWRRSGIPSFCYEVIGENGPASYKITELLMTWELDDEGRTLNHCVGTYAPYCLSGQSSIWSLSRQDASGKVERLLTLQVQNAAKEMIQARGPNNRLPTAEELGILAAWTQAGGPKVASWLPI
jgi:PcfJ-like protein